jgi:hypothetical protein
MDESGLLIKGLSDFDEESNIMASIQDTLLNQLKETFSRPRPFNQQVVNAIASQYNYTEDRLKAFLEEKFPELDEVAQDLTFSPLFTPGLEERAAFCAELKAECLTRQQVMEMVSTLTDENLRAPFQMPSGEILELPLTEVMLDRYLGRLYLDKPISAKVHDAIQQNIPNEDYGLANALGRETIWTTSQREALLIRFLETFKQRSSYEFDKLKALTSFTKTYRPKSLKEFEGNLNSLIESCEQDMSNTEKRGYYDEGLLHQYSGHVESDLTEAEVIKAHYERLIRLAQALLSDIKDMSIPA